MVYYPGIAIQKPKQCQLWGRPWSVCRTRRTTDFRRWDGSFLMSKASTENGSIFMCWLGATSLKTEKLKSFGFRFLWRPTEKMEFESWDYIYISFFLLTVVEDGFLEHFPQLLVSCHPQLENDGFDMIQRVEKMFSHVLTSLQLPDRIVDYGETYAKNELFGRIGQVTDAAWQSQRRSVGRALCPADGWQI